MEENNNITVIRPAERIIYVEPNDIFGSVDGIPLTPDYTDLCISFDLIVEVVSRLRANSATISKDAEDNSTKTYVISWTSKYGENEETGPNYVSFMGGENYGVKDGPSYLTTYYVDSHYNEFKNRTIVEGLGVESLSITFETYYAPTVKIRFIDVRGASIFGREEVLHEDEVLKEDNIWGCFFTFPYPKYKLQVKGFYGRAVTYQLCCTDFRAQFNSQTGNYEIDMSFVGYDFGLLADLPLQYVIAAPNCKYADTESFWRTQALSNPDWRLSDGRSPEKFLEIRNKIRETLQTYSNKEEEEVTVVEIEEEVVNGEKNEYIKQMKTYSDEILKNPGFKNAVDNAKAGKTTTLKPDFSNPQYGKLNITSMMESGKDVNEHKNWFNEISATLYKLGLMYSEYKAKWPTSDLSKLDSHLLYNPYNIESEKEKAEKNLPKDFAAFYEALTKETAIETVTRREDVRKTPEKSEISQKIWELVGLTPNIGNVFLTLYCHIETFAHMIYECAERIEGQIRRGERYLKNLGLPSSAYVDVDFGPNEKEKQIDPFPAVYTFEKVDENKSEKSDDAQETDSSTDDVKVDAWIREVVAKGTPPWEEEMLVENLYTAAMKVIEKEESNTVEFKTGSYPIIPCDLNYGEVAGVALKYTPEDLAGYMALRAAAIFGISKLPEKEANNIGKADAINYFTSGPQKETIQKKIFDQLTATEGNYADILYNIALCKSKDGKYPFEEYGLYVDDNREKNQNTRQPFFVEKDGKLHYSYTTNGKDLKGSNNDVIQYVPVRLNSWDGIKNNDLYPNIPKGRKNGDRIGYYLVLSNNDDNTYESTVLHSRWSSGIFDNRYYTVKNEPNTIVTKQEYINNNIFTIYYGGMNYNEKIEEVYQELKEGNVDVNGYSANQKEVFSPIVKTWNFVDDNSLRSRYYSDSTQIRKLLNTLYPSEKEKKEIDSWEPSKYMTDFVNKGVINYLDGSFKDGSTEYSENDFFVIPFLSLKTSIPNNNAFFKVNVFTTDIYYKQNEKKNGVDEAKALLFLLAITNGMFGKDITKKRPLFITPSCGMVEGIPLPLILLYGGLIWRKREFEETKHDVFLFPNNNDGAGKTYKGLGSNDIPIFNFNSKVEHGFLTKGETDGYYKLTDLTGINGKGMLDATMANLMIEKFKWFVANEWPKIRDGFELSDRLTAKDFIKIAKSTNNQTYDFAIENKELKERLNQYTLLSEYNEKYAFAISSITGNCIFSIPWDGGENTNKEIMDILKSMYLKKVFIQKTVGSFSNSDAKAGNDIAISKNAFKNYISGFTEQLKTMVDSETVNSIENKSDYEDDEQTRDLKRLIYMFLKNLWDRWFSGNDEKLFTVKNYMANTIFMDSMYRNVYENIHINCEMLLDLITQYDEKSMVFKFLSDITTRHNCMFFALPDYINIGNENDSDAESAMETLFKPMPFSNINKIESFNKYIVMFTHQPSQINDNKNGYKYDSFDLYSHDSDKLSILSTFKRNCMSGTSENDTKHNKMIRRYGYNVPSFGVSFGRQHNSIFKNVSVGMQNPIQTEQTIDAMARLAEKGGGSGSRMVFYGQDLYTVFSGYAYTATIEMMGNAQIMPLMYFQLFNIPMFRGAYMIYSVSHTMKPGDMTTTVKAMKMSKHTLPYCQEWFTHYYFDSQGNVIKNSDDECNVISDCKDLASYHVDAANLSEHEALATKGVDWKITHIKEKDTEAKCKQLITTIKIKVHSSQESTKEYNIQVNKNLADKFQAIFDEIYRTKINVDGKEKWLVVNQPPHAYKWRTVQGTGKAEVKLSNHSYGVAIDINANMNPYDCQKALQISKKDTEVCIRTTESQFVKIFAKYGFGWGGRYKDFMHFSYFDGR